MDFTRDPLEPFRAFFRAGMEVYTLRLTES